jgi:hypothetical protein
VKSLPHGERREKEKVNQEIWLARAIVALALVTIVGGIAFQCLATVICGVVALIASICALALLELVRALAPVFDIFLRVIFGRR